MSDLYLVTSLTELLTTSAVRRARAEVDALGGLSTPSTETQAADDIAVLFGFPVSLPPDLQQAFLAHADVFGDWAETTVALFEPETPEEAIQQRFRDLVADRRIERIFVHSLSKPIERAVFALWPDAEIILFDNGLSSHISRRLEPRDGSSPWQFVRREALAQVKEAWFTLGEFLEPPAVLGEDRPRDLPPQMLRRAIRSALERLDARGEAPPTSEEPRDLILGTAFFRTGRVGFKKERAAYLELLSDLKAEGRPTPLFKPHPRQGEKPILTAEDGVEVIDSHLPVELWAERQAISRSFSIASSGLLTLKLLNQTPGIRFARKTIRPVRKAARHVRLLDRWCPEWAPRWERAPIIAGIGLAKTGTKTLAEALRLLRVHPRIGFNAPALQEFSETGSTIRAEAALLGRAACVDWPWPLMFKTIDEAHPGSKFILTRRRDTQAWVTSVKHQALLKPNSPYRQRVFGFADPRGREDELAALYEAHLETVRAHFKDRPDDLLEVCWEDGDGWDALCSFLGLEAPDSPFPHRNETPQEIRALAAAVSASASEGYQSLDEIRAVAGAAVRPVPPLPAPPEDHRYALLRGMHKAEIRTDPFPHAVVPNCLPQKVYERLAKTFPSARVAAEVLAADNKRHDLFASWGKSRFAPETAPPSWYAFMTENSQPELAEAVRRLFAQDLAEAGDRLFSAQAAEDFAAGRIELRVSIGVNTPPRTRGSVRGPHCDNRTKAFVALFYLKDEAEGAGGDLELYRWKPGRERRGEWASAIDPNDVEIAATVPYAANQLVVFPNWDDAIHGVSPRDPSDSLRRLVVISGWFPAFEGDEISRASLGLEGAGTTR
jgi:hypothetical protein